MQNKNMLLQEEVKNSNNVFLSEDLKEQLYEYDESIENFQKSFFVYLSFKDDSFIKCDIIKIKKTTGFYKVCFIGNKEPLVSLCKSSVNKVILEISNEVIMDIDTSDTFVDYTVKLHDHNIYIYNLKIARDKNGI